MCHVSDTLHIGVQGTLALAHIKGESSSIGLWQFPEFRSKVNTEDSNECVLLLNLIVLNAGIETKIF